MKRALWCWMMACCGAAILVAYVMLVPMPTKPALVDFYIAGAFVAAAAGFYVTLTPYPQRKG